MYIIKDWANNVLFDGKVFSSHDEGWAFLYETFPDEEDLSDYAVLPLEVDK